MLKRLEAIQAKLLTLYGEGKTELSEIIDDVEEAIGWHKAATEEPAATEVKELPAGYPPITPS